MAIITISSRGMSYEAPPDYYYCVNRCGHPVDILFHNRWPSLIAIAVSRSINLSTAYQHAAPQVQSFK
jgi:hypothetical protein